MSTKVITFIIISLVLVIPAVNAQIDVDEKANQNLVEVTISDEGDIHVKHIVSPSKLPKQMKLIDGTVQNLTIANEENIGQLLTIIGNNNTVKIIPSSNNSIVEYDLEDVLFLKDNIWTWNFRYLETTSFIFPEKFDLVFINHKSVYLGDKKGISCHGCQMILEFSIDEPKNVKKVNWEDKEFFVEIRTFVDIENFNFNQSTKKISFKINDDNQSITTIIPLELLWGPYAVFLDDEKIAFHEYNNNGTHVWVNLRPDTTGEITIVGTTVVPEFPIIAPLAIGFLIILAVPLIRKFNLH